MILDIVRSLFYCLDQLIYNFIPTVYNFIMVLARVQVFDEGTLENFANNIYAILGIFMLFRLSFSIIVYIVNPDQLLDEKKGMGKIAVRIVTALVLIIAIPYLFKYSRDLQDMILDNGVINKVIIGTNPRSKASPGETMSTYSLQAFLKCSDACLAGVESNDDKMVKHFTLLNNDLANHELEHISVIINDKEDDKYVYDYTFVISTITGGFILFMLIMYCFDIALRTVKLGFLQLISPVAVVSYVDPKSSEDGFFSKWLKMSTSTYISLFIRIAALAFMIFIINRIPNIYEGIVGDPAHYGIETTASTNAIIDDVKITPLIINDNKNNQNITFDILDNNLNNSIPKAKMMANSTFGNVKLSDAEVQTLATFIVIFIIIGILMFVKEAPKILADLFGLKEDGLGTFKNPLQKMFGGAAIGAGIGIGAKAVGGLAGGVAGGWQAKRRGGSFWAGAGQGALQGSKNIKLKDMASMGTGAKGVMGKALLGSTIGAWGKGRDYAASKVTGKEEKRGIINAIKGKMGSTAQSMHTGKSEKELRDRGEALRNQINKAAGRSDWGRGNDTAYEIARDRAAATKKIFDNKEFADAYERSKIASGTLKDEKELLTAYQNQISVANAKYQSTGAATDLSEIQRLQEAIDKQTIYVSKIEESSNLYSKDFEDLKKKDYNKKNVSDLEALEAHDAYQDAKDRIP